MASPRKDKLQRDRRLLAKHRAHFESVLDKLGIRATFDRLPLPFRNRLYVFRVPPTTVELAPDLTGISRAAKLEADLRELLGQPIVAVPDRPDAEKLSFRDVYGPLFTLQIFLNRNLTGRTRHPDIADAIGWPCNDDYFPFSAEFDRQFHLHLLWHAQVHSRLDERTFVADLHRSTALGAICERVIRVSAQPARSRNFHRQDDRARRAWQAAIGIPHNGVQWLQWDPEQLGLPAGPPLPVFVQRHALQRLEERVPGDRGPEKTGGLSMLLVGALSRPHIAQRRDDAWWITLGDFAHRPLGYLLAERADNAILVRTFKTLTMDGSPEARRLHKRLGTRRADFEHLRLDQLSTFVETDVPSDPELRAIFTACGCGHLFDLRQHWDWPEPTDTRTAQFIKSYLTLTPTPKRPLAA